MTDADDGMGTAAPGTKLVDMAMGYSRSRVVCAAARLGIADALSNGERTVEQLASACSADPASLHRLLRALASIGIVTETAPGSFALTPLGEPLRHDVPQSAWAAVVFWGDLLADNWSHLTECVRTGETAGRVMGTAPAEQYAAIANSWDFSRGQTVADLGGGGGSLMVAILRSSPHLKGMLVERPAAVEAVPAGADVYVLPGDGRVLVIEFVLPNTVNRVDPDLERCLMSDLNMLAVTGGKERTEAEWARLVERADLELLRVIPVPGDRVSVLEASRPGVAG